MAIDVYKQSLEMAKATAAGVRPAMERASLDIKPSDVDRKTWRALRRISEGNQVFMTGTPNGEIAFMARPELITEKDGKQVIRLWPETIEDLARAIPTEKRPEQGAVLRGFIRR